MSLRDYGRKVLKRKFLAGGVLILLAGGAWYAFRGAQNSQPVRYVLTEVTRGAVVASVAATGQVSAENQLDVTPQVSGSLSQTFVKLGQEVKTGDRLFQIDARTAQKNVRDAEQALRDADIGLQSARIAYEKVVKPQNEASILQAKNALNQAQRNLIELENGPEAIDILNAQAKVDTAKRNVALADDGKTPQIVRDAYDKTVASLETMLVQVQKSLDDADGVLGVDHPTTNPSLATLFSVLDQSKKNQAASEYVAAKQSVEAARNAIDPLRVSGEDPSRIESALAAMNGALESLRLVLNDVKDGLRASLTSVALSQTTLDQYSSTIQADIGSVTNGYGTLTTQKNAVSDAKHTFSDGQTALATAEAELEKVKAGADADQMAAAREAVQERQQALRDATKSPDAVDVKSAQNLIAQRASSLRNAQDGLRDARDALGDYTVRALFDGVIAKLPVKNAGQVSPSTVLATLLTKAKIAQVSLNEVDVSKMRVGQKATLTFDAVSGLSIAGEVREVDLVGTASQGVVSYTVKIAFLTEDERIKPGMSVSASIVTDVRSDVLRVANAAVKGSGESAAVSVLDGVPLTSSSTSVGVSSSVAPRQVSVTAGLSDDAFTEIISGLNEGDAVLLRIVQPTAAAATTSGSGSQNSALRIPGVTGGTGFGAGGVRRPD